MLVSVSGGAEHRLLAAALQLPNVLSQSDTPSPPAGAGGGGGAAAVLDAFLYK